jgi:hypothetical protein
MRLRDLTRVTFASILSAGLFLMVAGGGNPVAHASGQGATVDKGPACTILRYPALGATGTSQNVTTPSGNFNGFCHADYSTISSTPPSQTIVVPDGVCFAGAGTGTIVLTKSGNVEGQCHVH